jgi:hypothetical protein
LRGKMFTYAAASSDSGTSTDAVKIIVASI